MSSQTIPIFGDFSRVNLGEYDREMIVSAFEAVQSVDGGWAILGRPDVPGRRDCLYCGIETERRPTCRICEGEGTVERSFMFDAQSHPDPIVGQIINRITEAVLDRYGGHSGASFGGTMRVMELIAKKGWDSYVLQRGLKKETMEEKRKRFLALPTNMTVQEQLNAIEEFKDVPMSYSELRARFG